MKNKNIISWVLIIFVFVLYFLTVKNIISSIIFLILTLIISFYFFPIKIILNKENENKLINGLSNFFTSISITFLIFNYYVLENIIFNYLGLILLLINFYFIYMYMKISKEYMITHLLLIIVLTSKFI
jgi:hypothetical protein